jgi:hypothetical protein
MRAFPLLLAVSVFACVSGSTVSEVAPSAATASDGGSESGDGGSNASAHPTICDVSGPTPLGGGLTITPGQSVAISAAQSPEWQQVSSAPGCASLRPGSVPRARTWTWDGMNSPTRFCYFPNLTTAGDLNIASISGQGYVTSFLPADGSVGAELTASFNDIPMAILPHSAQFVLIQQTSEPTCGFIGTISPTAVPTSPPQYIETDGTDFVTGLAINPVGGYIEEKSIDQGGGLQLRWIDDAYQPVGDWHTVVTWKELNNWSLYVDEQGRALVLSFMFPRSIGKPPPPSAWTFTAQWMDADGPIGAAFTPIAPVFTSNVGSSFPGFGPALALPQGGLAFYSAPASASTGGTVSPAGWYVAFARGCTRLCGDRARSAGVHRAGADRVCDRGDLLSTPA